MFDPRIGTLLRNAARLLVRSEPATTDAALLDRLAHKRDDTAFEELLARHGPSIWALCRRLLRSEPDAEDVFQATFLVLARDAARVRKAASVGSWLHGVAFRISRKVRLRGERSLDTSRLTSPVEANEPVTELSWNEIRSTLDEELAKLPDQLRAPLLLCYFQGMTQDEAATELGWSQRTVKYRIARGRNLLRERLIRRGLELPAVFAVPLLSTGTTSAAPPQLQSALSKSARVFLHKKPLGSDLSPQVLALTRAEVSIVSLFRLAILVATVTGLAVAGTLIGRQIDPIAMQPIASSEDDNPPAPALDRDPTLPLGAVRIGSTQFRFNYSRYGNKVFYTTDGKTLILPMTGSVYFWDAESGRRMFELPVPDASIEDADFLAGSNLLALFGRFSPPNPAKKSAPALFIVDTAARKVMRIIALPDINNTVYYHVRLSRDGKRAVTATDGEIRVWDVESSEELIRRKHQPQITSIGLSPDGKTIFYDRYSELFQWKWESGQEPKKITTLQGGPPKGCITFTDNSNTMFAGGGSGNITPFEVSTGKQLEVLNVEATPSCWSLSPDGRTLAVSYAETTHKKLTDPCITLWDLASRKPIARYSTGRCEANFVNWSPDGTRLVASTGHRLMTWDAKTGMPVPPNSSGHEDTIRGLEFSPEGRLFTACSDHILRSWDTSSGKLDLELVHNDWIYTLAVSPDGSLVAGAANQDLRIWDAKTGRERFKLFGGRIPKMQFTPDGKKLVAWDDKCYLRIWDTRNAKLLAEHRILPEGVTEAELDDRMFSQMWMLAHQADISRDGSMFALFWNKVFVFNVETGKELMKFEIDDKSVAALAFSHDGKRLAISNRGKGTEIRLPNGRTEHSPAVEHQLKVWDLNSKKLMWESTSAGWSGNAIGFSPDGSSIAETAVPTNDRKNVLRIRDATTGKDIGKIDLPTPNSIFAFDRTGKRLAVANSDTTVVVYDLATALKPYAPK
jgi:RNA polymerase sigma factor (sigma-70 family)